MGGKLENEGDYIARRARQERIAEQVAASDLAREAHAQMACWFEERMKSGSVTPASPGAGVRI